MKNQDTLLSGQKINYFIGLVVLSILIPMKMALTHFSFKILLLFFWITTLGLIVFIVLDGYMKLQNLNGDAGKKYRKGILNHIIIGSKAVTGIGLLLVFLTIFIQFFIGLFSYQYNVEFKLFLPAILLAVFGSWFLRDMETANWIESNARWLIPIIRKQSEYVALKAKKAAIWIVSKRYLVGAIAIVVLLGFLLSVLLRPPEIFAKEITITAVSSDPFMMRSAVADSLVIDHDFDQNLKINVENTGVDTSAVFLRAISLNSKDSLVLGFTGEGSDFDEITPSTIYPNTTMQYNLILHAANAQLDEYEIMVQLFKYDSLRSPDAAELIDDKTFTVKVRTTPIQITFTNNGSDKNTLSQRYLIHNTGETISNFSLLEDDQLKGKIRMIPEVRNFRFQKGGVISIQVEPLLHVGFDSLAGDLIASGGGSKPMKKSLSFEAPPGKKVFLAVARCGSKNHKLSCNCINLKNVKDDVGKPPGFTGFTYEYNPPGVAKLELVEIEEEEKEEKTDEEDSESSPTVLPPDGNYIEGIPSELVLKDVAILEELLDNLMNEFTSRGAQLRIRAAKEEQLAAIRTAIGDKETLTADEVEVINEHMGDALDTYYLMTSEVVWRQRKSTLIRELLPDITGATNLRMTREWLKFNNADAPNIYYAENAVHFSWHYRAPTSSEKQYILYSAHTKQGEVLNETTDLTPEGEYGRWPFILEGSKGKTFFAWQGGKHGEKPEIKLRVSPDTGVTWNAPVSITNHQQGAYSPQLVFKNNTLYVLWLDMLNGDAQLRLAYSSDDGKTFSPPTTLASNVDPNSVSKFDVTGKSVHFVYNPSPGTGEDQLMYGSIALDQLNTPQPSVNLKALGSGHQAVVKAHEQTIHLSYVTGENNQSEVFYRYSKDEGALWSAPFQLTTDSAYSVSPSICFDKDKKVRIFYHSNKADPKIFLDHLYYRDQVAPQNWTTALRLPSLSGNAKKAFLAVKFKIPWNRNEYGKYNVKIRFNGYTVDHLEDFVPEGTLLYPIDPSWVRADGNNTVNLDADHFNPAHYLITYGFSLISDMEFIEQKIFARNQREADSLLMMDPLFNHAYPDLGLYAATDNQIPLEVKNDEQINIKLNLWNIGQAVSNNSIIDIYGGPSALSEDPYQDRYLLGQKKIDRLNPMDKKEIIFPVTYSSGLEKIFFRVRTQEKDFDETNNFHSLSLLGITTGYVDKGALRVAIFDEPGELSDAVDIKVYRAGADTPLKSGNKNPQIWWLDGGNYDVFIKNRSSNEVEQWIRGVSIDPINNNTITISLDILTQRIDETIQSLGAVESGDQIKFQLPSAVLFHSGEFEISTYSLDYLKKIQVLLKAYPESSLTIIGHTDNVGGTQRNLILSENRAESVKNWLVSLEGIDKNRLSVIGRGENEPVATNDTEEGRSKNRRVSFILNRN